MIGIRNPEFRRNLWIEFTVNKMAVGPALLAVLFIAAGVADWSIARETRLELTFPILSTVSRWTFLAIVLLWGGRQATGAVIREIRNRTWDGQRLSSMGPWTMTAGKFAGATSFSWALGLVCLAVYLVTGSIHNGFGATLYDALAISGLGVVCQTVGLLLSLTRVSRTPGFRPGNVTLLHFMALGATVLLMLAARAPGWFDLSWYGIVFDPIAFVAISAWFFGLWAVVGINRRMRRELQFHNGPLVWLAFLAVFAAYANGIAYQTNLPGTHLTTTYISVSLFVYLLVLFEPKDPEAAHRLIGMARSGRPGAALTALPLWLITYAVVALITVVGVVLILAGAFSNDLPFEGWSASRFLWVQLLATFLFLTRDLMIVLFFTLSREERQGEAIAFVCLFVLYGPLPAIFMFGRMEEVLTLFWPIGTKHWLLALLPILVQVALMAGALWWRWRAYWRPSPASRAT